MMDEDIRRLLRSQGYHLVGSHSAVKGCHWLKESLVRGRECYKARFYGISSHRCLQMTPAVAWCQHRCIFCWRPIEHTLGCEITGDVDEPAHIVEGAVEEQKRIVSGYWGHQWADKGKLKEAFEPRHVAISLAGEPTTYPYIAELIERFKDRGMTTFLVTNGQNPERLAHVRPTQLYLSLIAYDRDLYKRINAPQLPGGWERLNESLEVFRDNPSRKVIRITLVRGYNLERPELFAPFIERAEPDFIEPKGYVHVGYSRRRLNRGDMPSLEEVLEFSRRLAAATGYSIRDHSPESKVALLEKK
ncbi:MAG: 4-demethylwyosine synthase TYW1 [Methanobacteriota archaeon]|nr:MAG: 4-demethylwyosine synthase TYW1 [Euryarchaeota archaeon]